MTSSWREFPGGIERTFPSVPMRAEEGAFDISGLDVETLREVPKNRQKLVPVDEGEASARRSPGDRTGCVKDLPGANIDDAVAPRIQEHQNRRGHRHRHAAQPHERVEASAFGGRCKSQASGAADSRGAVIPDLVNSPRRLPKADCFQLASRKVAPRSRRAQPSNQGFGSCIFLRG